MGFEIGQYVCLREENGKTYTVKLIDESLKTKGLGVINSWRLLNESKLGEQIKIGQKTFAIMPPRLPELIKGMRRKAQTISAKDSGLFISKMGIGTGDRVLETGLGSAGLALHLSRVLGNEGLLVSVENRAEHAEVGMENLQRASEGWGLFPEHHLIEGEISGVINQVLDISTEFEAILLDLPEHPPVIKAVAKLLTIGGRLACYCPVTSQLENSWNTCEEMGLQIEWAGELMDREWSKASKGGVRPTNGPFGHTAFLLIAQRIS